MRTLHLLTLEELQQKDLQHVTDVVCMFIGLEADYTYRSCLSLDSQLISASSHRVAFYHSAASAAAAAAAAAAADDDDVLTTLRVDVSTSHV